MSEKVAVASSDGIVVNAHFGQAEVFYIYEKNEDEITFFEKRILEEDAVGCACGDNHEDTLSKKVEAIKDCDYVIVSRIGPGAEYLLLDNGIKSFQIADVIEEALKKMLGYIEIDELLSGKRKLS